MSGWIKDKDGTLTYYPPQDGEDVAKRNGRPVTREYKKNSNLTKVKVAKAAPPDWEHQTNQSGHPTTVAQVKSETSILYRDSFFGHSAAMLGEYEKDVKSFEPFLEKGKETKKALDIYGEISKNKGPFGGTFIYDGNRMEAWRWSPNPDYTLVKSPLSASNRMYNPDKVYSFSVGNGLTRTADFFGKSIDYADKAVTVFEVYNEFSKGGSGSPEFQRAATKAVVSEAVGIGNDRVMAAWPYGTIVGGALKIVGIDDKAGEAAGDWAYEGAVKNEQYLAEQSRRKARLEEWASKKGMTLEDAQARFRANDPNYNKIPTGRVYLTIDDVFFTPESKEDTYNIPKEELGSE